MHVIIVGMVVAGISCYQPYVTILLIYWVFIVINDKHNNKMYIASRCCRGCAEPRIDCTRRVLNPNPKVCHFNSVPMKSNKLSGS
jgi:hypothetical protein